MRGFVAFYVENGVKDKKNAVPEGVASHADVFSVIVTFCFYIQFSVFYEDGFGVFNVAACFFDRVFLFHRYGYFLLIIIYFDAANIQ